jgi:predicted nucleic acid-binding protein
MRTVFADASYWIALLNAEDALHERAKSVSYSVDPRRIVTSEMVLTELLNDLGGKGWRLRLAAVALVQDLRRDSSVSIILQTTDRFGEALSLYAQRSDKAWGLTDCSSFQIMTERGLTQALTHDRHFVQAGFQALLRSP